MKLFLKSTKNIQKLPSVKVVQVGLTNDSVASWSDKMKNMSESDFVGMMRQLMDKNIREPVKNVLAEFVR